MLLLGKLLHYKKRISRLLTLSAHTILKYSLLVVKNKLFGNLSSSELEYYTYFYFLLQTDFILNKKDNQYLVTQQDGFTLALRNYPSSDALVYAQIFDKQEYQDIITLTNQYLDKSKPINIIDAGANVGYSMIYFNKLLKDYSINMILIEPDLENVKMIARNVLLNDLSNVNIETAGLYNKSCFLKITNAFMDRKEWAYQVEESATDTGLRSVELTELVDKYEMDCIDILKIDIEGGERFLFSDADYASKILKRVKILALEIHDQYKIRSTIYQRLTDNGFSYYDKHETTIAYKNLS